MTRRLILTRHAKSSWDDPLITDHERVLNGRGRRSARAIGDWLRAQNAWTDQTLCSDSARTRETCQLLDMGGDQVFLEGLYHASSDRMLRILQGATGAHVLMIGHNPGIGELATRLAKSPPSHPRFADYPTCATTIFDFDIDDWADLTPATGTVRHFTIPRDLGE